MDARRQPRAARHLRQGFRAPSSTENSAGSLAAFGGATVDDNARCAALAGLPQPTIDANCKGVAPTFVQRGNPDLSRRSRRASRSALVWDITPKSSVTADLWQIKRKGLPVIEDPQAAVDAGHVTRDPADQAVAERSGRDPERLGAVPELVEEPDQRLRRRSQEPAATWAAATARLTTGVTWTHLFTQRVTDADGIEHDYAGTHGDCNITNCIGSPRDRVSFDGDLGLRRRGGSAPT